MYQCWIQVVFGVKPMYQCWIQVVFGVKYYVSLQHILFTAFRIQYPL
jgi:hypothetical protein